MSEENGFYRDKYFEELNNRISNLEKKIDKLITQVTYIYAWSSGVATIAAIIVNYFIHH